MSQSQVKFGAYVARTDPRELFERLKKPKTLELETRPTCKCRCCYYEVYQKKLTNHLLKYGPF